MKARIAAVVTGISCCIAAVAWCGTNRTPRDTGFVRVRDSAGNPLPSATIRLYPRAHQVSLMHSWRTDHHGEARISFDQPLTYGLDVACEGYATQRLIPVAFPVKVTLSRTSRR